MDLTGAIDGAVRMILFDIGYHNSSFGNLLRRNQSPKVGAK
jgi:hypothetical protein